MSKLEEDILKRNVADLEIALRKQTERAKAAEAELAKLREQKPVAYVKYKTTGGNVGLSWLAVPTGEFYPREGEQLYAAPVPAHAAPASRNGCAELMTHNAGVTGSGEKI